MDEIPNGSTIKEREHLYDDSMKVAFFANGKRSGVVEALRRAADQLEGRQMKQYISSANNPTEIRWFKQ
jgi:hypothetical protein